jgi:hypothetical protein
VRQAFFDTREEGRTFASAIEVGFRRFLLHHHIGNRFAHVDSWYMDYARSLVIPGLLEW